MQLQFGAGDVFATLVQDAYGNAPSVANPIRLLGLQEFSLSLDSDLKEFHGQGRFALAVAAGKTKATGKIKGALIQGLALNTLFFGTGVTTGTMHAIQADTTGALIPASPYTVTPTVPSSGTWSEDLGVIDANGRPMVKVASAPATGQYSVAAGVYTFAAADTGQRVFISYRYSFTSVPAKKIDLVNNAMGFQPIVRLQYLGQFQGKRALVDLSSVVCPKLSLFGAKNDDFSVPELDYSAQADATGFSLGSIYLSE